MMGQSHGVVFSTHLGLESSSEPVSVVGVGFRISLYSSSKTKIKTGWGHFYLVCLPLQDFSVLGSHFDEEVSS